MEKDVTKQVIINQMKEITGSVSFFSSGYFLLLEKLNVAHINDGVQFIAALIGLYWIALKVKREKMEIQSLKNKKEKTGLEKK